MSDDNIEVASVTGEVLSDIVVQEANGEQSGVVQATAHLQVAERIPHQKRIRAGAGQGVEGSVLEGDFTLVQHVDEGLSKANNAMRGGVAEFHEVGDDMDVGQKQILANQQLVDDV